MVKSMITRIYICPTHGEFHISSSIKLEPMKECPTCKSELKRKFALTDVLFCTLNKHRFTGISPQKEMPILND